VPSLRYRDVAAAIDWLCRAFGFEERHVVADADGTIRHALLGLGNDLILLLPALASDAARNRQIEGGYNDAQSLYFVVEDPEAHYALAEAAGAEAVDDGEYAFGGHGYSCRDPEGHIWHFGTFNPRQDDTTDGAWIRDFLHGRRARDFAERLRERFSPPILAAAVVATIVAAAAVAWMLLALTQTSASAKERGLALKGMWSQAEEPGVRSLARLEERLPAATPDPQAVAPVRRAEEVSERPGPQIPDGVRLNTSAFASVANSRRGDETTDRTVRLESERSAEEALKKARIPQRTAQQAFKQRTARKAALATQTREQQIARDRAVKEAAVREAAEKEAVAKATAAKEASAKAAAAKEAETKAAASKKAAERPRREASNWSTETERVAPSPAPAARVARPPQGQNGEGWECTPSQPSGQIVCNPAKKPATAKAAASKQNTFETTSETVPASVMPQPQVSRQPQEPDQAASIQLWDCQPAPPTGDIVCRPVRAQGGRASP
jgi:uncharacterized glyoxalase superfamily protein PhnB